MQSFVSNADIKLSNPLRGMPHDHLMADVKIFAEERGLTHLLPELKKGALVAQDSTCMSTWQIFFLADLRSLMCRS
jgi:hypothetical protein